MCLLTVSPSASANEFYSLSLGLGEETNVPRGLDGFHELGSIFNSVEFSAGKLLQLGVNDSVLVSVAASHTHFSELPGFDRLEFGLGADYRHKFGFGPTAPSVNINSRYALVRSDGSARDTDLALVGLSLAKQFQSGFSLNTGLDYQRNTTDLLPEDPSVTAFGYDPVLRAPYELFDFSSVSVFVSADYTFYNAWLVSLSVRRINGATVVSTTTPSLALYKVSDGFYSDPAFSSDPGSSPWFAYQVETNTDQYSAGVSIPIFQDTSIDITGSWNDIRAPIGRHYENTLYAISLTHNF
jgi:hypothetical protein